MCSSSEPGTDVAIIPDKCLTCNEKALQKFNISIFHLIYFMDIFMCSVFVVWKVSKINRYYETTSRHIVTQHNQLIELYFNQKGSTQILTFLGLLINLFRFKFQEYQACY